MPRRNTIRNFATNGFYHIYNRGVEKRIIFQDDQDYVVFLHLLKFYLSPIDPNQAHPFMEFQSFKVVRPRPLENLEKKVNLMAFCLMPNHFHLLLQQINATGVTELLSKISTIYAMYFNKRYKRVGYLFQGPYRAVAVETDSYLLHLSRYIHLNPAELTGGTPVSYPYSSYQYYLGQKHATWVKPKIILDYFDKSELHSSFGNHQSYQDFVEKGLGDSKEIIGKLALE